MGRNWVIGALFSAVAVAAIACGTTTEPVDPGDAGPDASPPVDGEADALDDGGTPPKDAGPEADAKPTSGFCGTLTPTPAFCDDFDDDDVDDDWTILTQVNGIGDLNEASATSIPASFTVQTAELANGQTANVHLRLTKLGAQTRYRLAFNTFLPNVTFTTGAVAIATLDVSLNHFFTLYIRDTDTNAPAPVLEETVPGTTTRHVLTKAPPANTWTRITIELDLTAGTASVLYGAEKVLDNEAITKTATAEATIRLGAVYTFGPFPEFEARFDDVALSFP